MKRKDLIRQLVDAGCYSKHHGKRHDLYENPTNGRKSPVPRHAEIKDTLCE
ncbi:MAG: type II toxin-antitoxin system HicA family toxin [Deltaproteobacteria bacterium]|nr:type II toxin-antitoxin system HicA family toxin [Deltaproteobacteria bacterium]